MPRTDYHERQTARIERLHDQADRAQIKAEALNMQGSAMSDVIPFGQPILVGHHSEKRDRNFRNKINQKFEKAHEERGKADHYRQKAAAAENNRAISSDDPEAVQKLQGKIENAEQFQQTMKDANRIIRKKPKNQTTPEKISELQKIMPSLTPQEIEKIFQPDFCGRIGFPDYALQNNNANVRRMKQRLEELKRTTTEAGQEETRTDYPGFSVIENPEANRIQIDFHSKSDYYNLCKSKGINLKSFGFRFSRNDGNVWQRLLNNAGRHAARQVAEAIQN